jgi:Carboxypeptidase regulatory-like domain
MLKRRWLCASLVSLCLGLAMPGWGQAPVGSLTGTVRDQSGLVMAGVTVTVTNKDTGVARDLTTSTAGIYSAPSLAPGNYLVKATAEGFRPLEVNATVQIGQVTTADLVLQVGTETSVVNVQAQAAQINYDSHEIAGVITHQDIQSLPLNGRSFLQLSMLQPGVTVTANNVGQYNKQFDVSILGAGSANNSVRITVDGATVADAINGGTQQNFSQEVVQEFQLSSTNFDLSTGIGAGGSINIVTRSGGNDFHGSAFFFYRDHNMSAFPTLSHEPGEPSSPYFARKQEGYWLGGPIKKDKLFFFSALEHTDQTALYSAFPSDPLFQALGTNASSPYHSNELTEKFNWNISAKNTAFLRYSHDGNNSFAPPGLGNLPSDWNVNTNWADSGVVSLVSALTPTMVNEARYSYTFWSNTNEPPTLAQCPAPCLGWDYVHNQDGPEITILGVNNFALGQAATAPQSRLLRRHVFADNMNWQKGTHAIKYGGYWEHSKGTGSYAYFDPAAVELWSPESVAAVAPQRAASYPSAFTTINDLLKLPVYAFTIGVGNPTQPPLYKRGDADHDNLFHIYAEDTWKIRPRFSLNYGLAWSYESNALNYDLTKPQFLAPIYGANGLGRERNSPYNFSPMLGFAWSVTKDDKTVIRAGAAIYYDTWNIYNRLLERVILAPVGIGRIPVPDSALFSKIPAVGFVSGTKPKSLQSEPTSLNGYEFNLLLPSQLVPGINSVLGGTYPPDTLNLDLFGTGFGLIPTDFRLPYSEHFSIGIQREIRSDLVISADFVFRQYMHQLITNADLNHYNSAAGPVIPACPQNVPGLIPGDANCTSGPLESMISGGRSHYKGLLVKVDKRFSHFFAGSLAYAYAHEVGLNGLVDNSNWFASWGPQAGHQTLTGSLILFLPGGFEVSGITSFQSAPPVQPYLTGIDLNGNGVFAVAGESPITGSPLPGTGYNEFGVSKGRSDLINLVNQFNQNYAGKMDPLGHVIPTITLPSDFTFPRSFNSQDVRVTKIFKLRPERLKLSIFGECFNVFNIANLTNYNTVLNAPNFGQATLRTENVFGTGGPRAFQLGARLLF